MRSFFVLLTILLAASVSVRAQANAEDSVKAVVQTLFDAMRSGDAAAFRSVFTANPVMQTIARNKEGKPDVITESVEEFAGFVGKLKKDSADERIQFETIRIDGPLAIVWTPYRFYHNGLFSHCGVNSFQLVRLGGIWKIQYLIDTRRRNGCGEN